MSCFCCGPVTVHREPVILFFSFCYIKSEQTDVSCLFTLFQNELTKQPKEKRAVLLAVHLYTFEADWYVLISSTISCMPRCRKKN